MILRARVIYPVGGPAIPDGALEVAGAVIRRVGPWKDFRPGRRPVVDLGETVVLPGLVNAHCHLDYTGMAGQLPPPKIFTDWLQTITELKAGWNLSDYERSWQAGARMLAESGTTTVADIEAVPELLPAMWQRTPLRIISFLEMIGITPRRPPAQLLDQTLRKACSLGLDRSGLSPHAPYSTIPALLRLTAAAARHQRLRISIHVAESALELEMFQHARGAMFDWLHRASRDMSDCGRGSPVRHLQSCGLLGERVLAAHVNYLTRGDAAILARSGTHVAHCPRSHFYFSHGRFPLATLRRAGVNLCLGTDSLASVYRRRGEAVALSMFDEMRTLAEAGHALHPEAILRMATMNGAKALGRAGRLGEFRPGAAADLILLPGGGPVRSLAEAIIHHRGCVSGSMIRGQWALPPGWLDTPRPLPHPSA